MRSTDRGHRDHPPAGDRQAGPGPEPIAVAHALTRPHPPVGEYLIVAAVLAAITAVEVAVYYVHALGPVLVPVLIALSASKFALVAMFYMHLKFDSRLFTGLFVLGIGIATVILLALLAIFAYHGGA